MESDELPDCGVLSYDCEGALFATLGHVSLNMIVVTLGCLFLLLFIPIVRSYFVAFLLR